MWFMVSADEVFTTTDSYSRVEIFMRPLQLIIGGSKLSGTFAEHQLVIDSKCRMLHNNHPLTDFGFFDAGLQFYLL